MIHLLRLAVGAESVDDIREFQLGRSNAHLPSGFGAVVYTITKRVPKRANELVDGGSLYWVVKGQIRVRQPIRLVERIETEEGQEKARLVLAQDWILTVPVTCRPFQGWRYFEPRAAPADLESLGSGSGSAPPVEMLADLKSLGLI